MWRLSLRGKKIGRSEVTKKHGRSKGNYSFFNGFSGSIRNAPRVKCAIYD